jgi:hypothetical protein
LEDGWWQGLPNNLLNLSPDLKKKIPLMTPAFRSFFMSKISGEKLRLCIENVSKSLGVKQNIVESVLVGVLLLKKGYYIYMYMYMYMFIYIYI